MLSTSLPPHLSKICIGLAFVTVTVSVGVAVGRVEKTPDSGIVLPKLDAGSGESDQLTQIASASDASRETAPIVSTANLSEQILRLSSAIPIERALAAAELRESPSTESVDGLIDAFRRAGSNRERAMIVYALTASRPVISHAGRDVLLDIEAMPILKEIVYGDTSDATGAAILALSDLRTPEAARTLSVVSLDPRDVSRADNALSALVARPHLTGVQALQETVNGRAPWTGKMRALRALVEIARPATGDEDAAAAAAEARRYLLSDGLAVASAAGVQSPIQEVKEVSVTLQKEIENLR